MQRLLARAGLCLALMASLPGAQAQTQIGIGGVHTDMVVDEVAATLAALGHKVFSKSAKYVEAILLDAETKGTVRVRFLFDDSASPRIKSVEFVEDDDKATRQLFAGPDRPYRSAGLDGRATGFHLFDG